MTCYEGAGDHGEAAEGEGEGSGPPDNNNDDDIDNDNNDDDNNDDDNDNDNNDDDNNDDDNNDNNNERVPPAQPVDAPDGGQVCRELHQGRDHEGEVELEVEVGDVPHGRVEDAADDRPGQDSEQADLPHLRGAEQIQISVIVAASGY